MWRTLEETFQHVLFECPRYTVAQRDKWKEELQEEGCSGFDLAAVLGFERRIWKSLTFLRDAGSYSRSRSSFVLYVPVSGDMRFTGKIHQ